MIKKTLALNLIVKNEKENLKKNNFKKIISLFDEVVIVDSGDPNQSDFLAKSKNTKIISYPQDINFRFDKARNIALKNSKSDYIMYLDADMKINNSDIISIKKIIQNTDKTKAFTLKINNVVPEKNEIFKRLMLFPNTNKISWKGSIHENIEQSCLKNKITIEDLPFQIHHYGYCTKELQEKKLSRNMSFLKRNIISKNYSINDIYMFAISLFDKKEFEEAKKYLKKCLAIPNIEKEFIFPYIFYYFALIDYENKDINSAIKNLNNAIKIRKDSSFLSLLGEIKYNNNIDPSDELKESLKSTTNQSVPIDDEYNKIQASTMLINWTAFNKIDDIEEIIPYIKPFLSKVTISSDICITIAQHLYGKNKILNSKLFFEKLEIHLKSYWENKKLPSNKNLLLKIISKRLKKVNYDYIALNMLKNILIKNNEIQKAKIYEKKIHSINPFFQNNNI